MHTHRGIISKTLRALFAKELWAMRKVARISGYDSEYLQGLRVGYEAAMIRVQAQVFGIY